MKNVRYIKDSPLIVFHVIPPIEKQFSFQAKDRPSGGLLLSVRGITTAAHIKSRHTFRVCLCCLL